MSQGAENVMKRNRKKTINKKVFLVNSPDNTHYRATPFTFTFIFITVVPEPEFNEIFKS